MAFESVDRDPITEEQDLQQWAEELGYSYELGTQGTLYQPVSEMDPARIEASAAIWAQRMRELGGLAAIIDAEERSLRVTTRDLARMTKEERENWNQRADDWLSRHPQALKYNLIDRPPKIP